MNSTTQLIYGHGNPTTCYTIKHCGSIHNTKQIRIIMHVWPKTQPCGTNHIYNTNITSFITIHNYMTHTNKQPNFSHIYLSVLLSHTQIHTHTHTHTNTHFVYCSVYHHIMPGDLLIIMPSTSNNIMGLINVNDDILKPFTRT